MPLSFYSSSFLRLLAGGTLLLATLFSVDVGRAQSSDSDSESTQGEWTYGASARLNASQAAYSNWEQGSGLNSLALASAVDGELAKRGESWIQSYEGRLAFGLINQEGQEVRKADDEILLNASLRYQGEGFFRLFNPTIAGNFRTQFASGFDFEENPYPETSPRSDDETPPFENSSFFAPAFITESVGLTYEPTRSFKVRLGVASKQTVVNEPDFRVLYGVDPDNVVRVEGGGELASSYDKQITENIRYQSRLNVFFAVNQTDNPPDARWDNVVSLQVNDWLSTDLTFEALFDDDISDAIQLKETISVGVSFTLI